MISMTNSLCSKNMSITSVFVRITRIYPVIDARDNIRQNISREHKVSVPGYSTPNVSDFQALFWDRRFASLNAAGSLPRRQF